MKYNYLFILLFPLLIYGNEYEVRTTSGIVYGTSISNVISWDDIPYALPPIGELRWKAPRELVSTDNTIKPKEDNFCVQEPSGLGGSDGTSYFSGTEDCLYLDIKAPSKKQDKLLPVMFWIHGGGNTAGLKDIYDFSSMVKKHNVIVITVNYRLGPFGWFTHPSIQNFQHGIDKTSNFGTLDLIESLKWVKNNISFFGGDPNNVTIFGESAGGHNVLSLLTSIQAKGLFHKAISQSGYTTSYSLSDAYRPQKPSSTSKHSSWNIVNKIIKDNFLEIIQTEKNNEAVRNLLKGLSAEEFFKYYSSRTPYENLPLLTADGIVLPSVGLTTALSKPEYVNMVPAILGSNRDEVKLWLASAKYFVELDYTFLGSIFGIPRVKLNDKKAFNLFNLYRSKAWKLRGVDGPLRSLHNAGNQDLYAYRYDWDDHRRFLIADFKELIGAAHATEIPLLTGNNKLVGDYGFLIYPRGPSKRFTSKNMMQFWASFAKNGKPGLSSNNVEWMKYNGQGNMPSNYMIIDNRKNLRMHSDEISFPSLINELYTETDLTNLEKCVVLLQMLTYVGDDLYDKYIQGYPGSCKRSESEQFVKDNSGFIDY